MDTRQPSLSTSRQKVGLTQQNQIPVHQAATQTISRKINTFNFAAPG
jgi:hypothetical protein